MLFLTDPFSTEVVDEDVDDEVVDDEDDDNNNAFSTK